MPLPEATIPILAFLTIVTLKFIMNLSWFLQSKRYLVDYTKHIGSPDWNFEESQPQVVQLFRRAGIKDASVPLVEEVGYGMVRKAHLPVFSNIGQGREDIVQVVLTMFHRAIGVYRTRMQEAFNPLYWIETIVYLPRELMTYIGVGADNAVVRIAQVSYWVANTVWISLLIISRLT